jgi:PAS domain S-box-containing protein
MREVTLFRFFDDNNCSTNWPFSFAIMLLIWFVINLVAIGISFAEDGEKTNRILYINSYAPGYSWSDDIQKGLFERFKSYDRKIEVFVEYLDSRRFTKLTLQNQQADIMFNKYAGYSLDLVVVSDNAAFSFAIKNRERLFPDIPIVFCGYNTFRPNVLSGLSNITGVNEEIDINSLIVTALNIQPKTRTLVFTLSTHDASAKPMTEMIEESIIPKYDDLYEIVLLKDIPMGQIKGKLTALPRESVLFLVGWSRDNDEERALTAIEYGREIATASPVPAFSFWDFLIDKGILGGRILSGYDQGKEAADMALQILNGKSAGSIPVLMKSPTRYIFDFSVMKRFNIEMDALPDNSIVINKPSSFYNKHKKIVWTTLIVIATLTVFIIVLSLNILHRQRAEKELQKHRDHLEDLVKERTATLADSEERFRSLSDAAFEGIVISEKGIFLEANNTMAKMFGYQTTELAGMAATDLVAPDLREKVQNKILSGHEKPYESLGITKDGTRFPIEVHAKMFSYKGRQVRVTAIRDLTEQKKAEEEIKALRGILPLCSFCKKIRNDKGYWEQVDVYIHKHSQADISHSICPECAKEYYPDLDIHE